MGKFYAVRKGKTPGIYLSWDECKSQVEGVPDAKYKSFKTQSEAEEFIQMEEKTFIKNKKNTYANKKPNPIDRPKPLPDEMIAYVDGSYHALTKEFSYGIVAFILEEEIHISEKVDEPDLAEMRNVAGEIKGSEAAMRLALEWECKKLIVYHDYEGIAKWCLGQWKANKEGTIAYKDYFNSIKDKLKVEFIKVKGHSHNRYNDLADALAKKAIGIN